MSAPGAPDETSVFIVTPDGWYGILSLRSPFVRRDSPIPGSAYTPDWDDWLRRLIGSGALERVSCHSGMSAWIGTLFIADQQFNEYAEGMLKSLAVKGRRVAGTVVFTGFVYGNGTTIGLNQDQFGSVASAYRMAQQKLLASQ